MNKPIYGKPMSTAEAMQHISSADTLRDMSWALKDWVEVVGWLGELGVPEMDDNNIWLSTVEKVKWLVQNVEQSKIIRS